MSKHNLAISILEDRLADTINDIATFRAKPNASDLSYWIRQAEGRKISLEETIAFLRANSRG